MTTRLHQAIRFRKPRYDNLSQGTLGRSPPQTPPATTTTTTTHGGDLKLPTSTLPAVEDQEQSRHSDIREAHDWLKDTILQSGRWTHHWSQIRIECPYTMAELRTFGRLPRIEGLHKCRTFIRVPVLYDEIGLFVWKKLAEMELGHNFRPLDDNDDDQEDRGQEEGVDGYRERPVADVRKWKRSEEVFAQLDERFRFPVLHIPQQQVMVPADAPGRCDDSPFESPKGTRGWLTSSLSSLSLGTSRRRSLSSNSQVCYFYNYYDCIEEGDELSEETSSDGWGCYTRGSV